MSFHLFRRAVAALLALAGVMIVAPAQAQSLPPLPTLSQRSSTQVSRLWHANRNTSEAQSLRASLTSAPCLSVSQAQPLPCTVCWTQRDGMRLWKTCWPSMLRSPLALPP